MLVTCVHRDRLGFISPSSMLNYIAFGSSLAPARRSMGQGGGAGDLLMYLTPLFG